MICPECESPTRVTKTTVSATNTVRALTCTDCGVRFESTEKITHQYRRVAISGQIPPPMAISQLPVATDSRGGVGGGLSSGSVSGQIPLTSVPSEQSGSVSEGDQGADPARAKAYPTKFETFWEATWKSGAKGAALKAWLAEKVSAMDAGPAIAAYLKAKRAAGQSPAHVSTWLRAGGATQTEWHLASINGTNSRPAPPQAAPAPYHAPAKQVQADWSQIAPWPTSFQNRNTNKGGTNET